MSSASEPAQSTPALRIVHAIVFLGFSAAAVAASHQELLHLFRALQQPFHSGTPPHPVACASGLVALVGGAALLFRAFRPKPISIVGSVLLLAAFGGSFSALTVEPKARTTPGANAKCLDQLKALHKRIDSSLQLGLRVPQASALSIDGLSVFHRRPFQALPWHVEEVSRSDALPDGAVPGWILYQPIDERTGFVLTAVGIDDEGQPSLLRKDGKPLEYRGASNPDTPR